MRFLFLVFLLFASLAPNPAWAGPGGITRPQGSIPDWPTAPGIRSIRRATN